MYSYKNDYPISTLPHRLREEDGNTITGIKDLDDEALLEIGFVKVDNPPNFSEFTHKLEWSGVEWQVVGLNAEELVIEENRLKELMINERNGYFEKEFWRVQRYESEIRLGLNPTDNINKLDAYFPLLRDITKQESFPFDIDWPEMDFADN